MRRFRALLLPLLALAAQPAAAQEIVYESVTIVEEVIPANAPVDSSASTDEGSARFIHAQPAPVPRGIAAYGPFRVLDAGRAALVDVTDTGSPAAFAAMLHAYPQIATIEMVDCPGTEDDRANLRLGLMIRSRGIATHIPEGGFVGSGAVELFLAGAHRYAEPTAEFAVHSWEDDLGREAKDYPSDAPENRAYIDYYEAVGMTVTEAKAFYAMTNSVPFASAKWLTRAEMAQWVQLDSASPALDSRHTLQ